MAWYVGFDVASMLNPRTHARPSLLLRKWYDFGRFDKAFRFRSDPPPLVIETQPSCVEDEHPLPFGRETLRPSRERLKRCVLIWFTKCASTNGPWFAQKHTGWANMYSVKIVLEYGVWAPVFFGNLREQTGDQCFPRMPAGSLFCSYRNLRKPPGVCGTM